MLGRRTSCRVIALLFLGILALAVGNVSGAPQTYMLDGKQYLLVAVGDTLAAFAVYGAQ